MADTTRYDLELPGCRPEPLMAYLKALGILRLISEQKDKDARSWWKKDVFWLRSAVLFGDTKEDEEKRNRLAKFFLEQYKPTPIVVPWTGSDFFDVKCVGNAGPFDKTPTATTVIEAVLASRTERLGHYREVIRAVLAAMAQIGVTRKEDIDSQKGKAAKQRKASFFSHLRQSLDDNVLAWIDAAGICAEDLRFSALLGSGGGSDGNTHFSDNFMQNLWDVFPDFDSQRKAKKNQEPPRAVDTSSALLRNALFEDGAAQLTQERTSSLYDSGAIGGPNATQGMERDSLANPWNIILALEGTIAFAGGAAKRLGANLPAEAAFPFQVSAVVTSGDRLADKERSGSEIWLPLWDRPARADELLTVFREGRAQCGKRVARSGLDMARAAATLGVDRGIGVFCRYAIVKGRVGGENYNSAASLGRFEVREQRGADLLCQIDQWLDSFRSASSADAPPRFGSALRQIDSAIFDFCRYGGPAHFAKILLALGRAEREMALTPGKIGQSKTKVDPIAGLSFDWVRAATGLADRDSRAPFDPAAVDHEIQVALALAGVRAADAERGKVGPLRANLEPVSTWYDPDAQRTRAAWAEKDRAVVWNAADLATNLSAVLDRRVMDGERQGCENLPLAPALDRLAASPAAIAAFLRGDLDDSRIEDLLWGLMLVDPPSDPAFRPQDRLCTCDEVADLPPVYCLLKLLFLPRDLEASQSPKRTYWKLAQLGARGSHRIRPEPAILGLLRAGRIGEAAAIAMRRMRASGLTPLPHRRSGGPSRDKEWSEVRLTPRQGGRLAAALLIPIAPFAIDALVQRVTRGEDFDHQADFFGALDDSLVATSQET